MKKPKANWDLMRLKRKPIKRKVLTMLKKGDK